MGDAWGGECACPIHGVFFELEGSYKMNAPVGVGVAVILLAKGGFVLLGLRHGSHGAGTWSTPGGKLEPAEDPLNCALRELEEETGLVLNHGGGDKFYPFPKMTNVAFEDQAWLTLFYTIRVPTPRLPELLEPGKCDGWIWAAEAAGRKLRLFPPFEKYVQRFGWPRDKR